MLACMHEAPEVHAFLLCISTMYFYYVFLLCISTMYLSGVLGRGGGVCVYRPHSVVCGSVCLLLL